MKYDFKLTVEVDEFYELEIKTPFQAFDQRDNSSYTDYKLETHRFATLEQANQWAVENRSVEIKSAVLIRNVLKEINA